MIEVTSFLLKHLYELMADNYIAANHHQHENNNGSHHNNGSGGNANQQRAHSQATTDRSQSDDTATDDISSEPYDAPFRGELEINGDEGDEQASTVIGGGHRWNCGQTLADHAEGHTTARSNYQLLIRRQQIRQEQETNQQIVAFLANNHLPDLACDTFIELLFICVFLAVSWIFVMIVQLHCHQLQQPARVFYCNTKLLASLMYCNNKSAQMVSM